MVKGEKDITAYARDADTIKRRVLRKQVSGENHGSQKESKQIGG
jgi:hypothetical protein